MKKRSYFTMMILLAMSAACSAVPSISNEDQLATIVAGTLTAQPTIIFTPIPTLTATNIPTVAVIPSVTSGPYYVFTKAQNVNLRTQPGTLFQVSRVMAQGTRLQVLSVSAGGEWAYVQNDEGINGWVDIEFVDAFPHEQFPVVAPNDVQIIRGRVLDSNGLPISGIGFAIEQITASKSLRTDSATDAFGVFYAYLPKNLSGTWTVSFISIYAASNAMTPECMANTSACGKTEPLSASIILPTDTQLNFIWE